MSCWITDSVSEFSTYLNEKTRKVGIKANTNNLYKSTCSVWWYKVRTIQATETLKKGK